MQPDQREKRVPERRVIAGEFVIAGEPGGEAKDRHDEEHGIEKHMRHLGEHRRPCGLALGMGRAAVDDPIEKTDCGRNENERAEDDVGVAEKDGCLVERLAVQRAVPECGHEFALDPLADDEDDDGPVEEHVETGPVGAAGIDGHGKGSERKKIVGLFLGSSDRRAHCRNYTLS